MFRFWVKVMENGSCVRRMFNGVFEIIVFCCVRKKIWYFLLFLDNRIIYLFCFVSILKFCKCVLLSEDSGRIS